MSENTKQLTDAEPTFSGMLEWEVVNILNSTGWVGQNNTWKRPEWEDGKSVGIGIALQELATELHALRQQVTAPTYQARATQWAVDCFPPACIKDRTERALRFAEESAELVQSAGVSIEKAHQIVDYVWNRPVEKDPSVEVGGTLVTLAVLCGNLGIDMAAAGEAGLAYCIANTDRIRTKHAEKHARGLISSDEPPAPASPVAEPPKAVQA